jgi:hypothetical protein
MCEGFSGQSRAESKLRLWFSAQLPTGALKVEIDLGARALRTGS